MSVSTDGQLDSLWYLHLHHCRLIIDDLLDSYNDLINVFLVKQLPVFETFRHVVDELLCHLLAEMHAIVGWLNGHGLDIEPLCGGGFITYLDCGEKLVLPNDFLALDELELGIFVPGVDFDACLEVLDCLFRL